MRSIFQIFITFFPKKYMEKKTTKINANKHKPIFLKTPQQRPPAGIFIHASMCVNQKN